MNIKEGRDAQDGIEGFPKKFNLFAYNDSTCTLLFTGYNSYDEKYRAESDLAVSDFEAFIDSAYSDCFAENADAED